MTWHTGQAWRVVNSLNKLNDQIRAYAPRAVPPATDVNAWGALADNAHSTSSDHYPHYYSALGGTAVVCARDFPHAPGLGLDGHVVTEALRISRDPRIGYLICDRRITGPNHGWRWETYTGDDPHDTHFHVSSVHDGRADSTAPWPLPGVSAQEAFMAGLTEAEQVDMYLNVKQASARTAALLALLDASSTPNGNFRNTAVPAAQRVSLEHNSLKDAIVASGVQVDTQAVAHEIAVELAADPANPLTDDDVPAIATAVADKLSARLSA
jgi:hypothetical protein